MPPHGKEVQLTELETQLMSVFVKHKILGDKEVADTLFTLYTKIMGNYATKKVEV